MAQRGPKPKPTKLRVLDGDPNKARYNFNEPVGSVFDASQIPEKVASSPDAMRIWHHLAPRLHKMGVLSEEDRFAFEALCVTYGMWSLRPSAQMTTKLQSLLCEFGLTPSSRTRLVGRLPHEKAEDPIAKRLSSG